MQIKKILITGNGGIYKDKKGNYWGQDTTGIFIKQFQQKGFIVLYVSHKGNKETSKFLYNYNYTANSINCKIIRGGRRNPLKYIGRIRLFFAILQHQFVYIFYPAGHSQRVAKYSFLLRKNYAIYIRGITNFNQDSKYLKNAKFINGLTDNIKNEIGLYNTNFYIVRSMMKFNLNDIKAIKIHKEINKIPILLFVGSAKEHKGFLELIKMSLLLTKRGFDHVLKIIGDGDLLPRHIFAQKKGLLPTNIKFMGSIIDKDELIIEYKKADAFIFPTHNEGLPRVLLEAMLVKIPIFTTIVGGIKSFMKDKYNCIEIPVKEPGEQTQIVYQNFHNSKLLSQLSDNAFYTANNILQSHKEHHEVLYENIKDIF